MPTLNPALDAWIVSFISVVLLSIQWIFIVLGWFGCCGFGLKKNHNNNNSKCLSTLTPTRSSSIFPVVKMPSLTPRQSIALCLFVSVTCSWISSVCTFLRRAIFFAPREVNFPQFVCEFFCRGSLLFYGVAKLIIYAMIYYKVLKLVDSGPPDEVRYALWKRRCLHTTVGVSLVGFALSVVEEVVSTNCVRTTTCTCFTPPQSAALMMVFDWIASATLLAFFCYPVVRQIMNPESQMKVIWKSVVVQQLKLALAVLLVAPCMVAIFIHLNASVPVANRTLSASGFLTVDLLICCYAQGFAALKIWEKRRPCHLSAPQVEERPSKMQRVSKDLNSTLSQLEDLPSNMQRVSKDLNSTTTMFNVKLSSSGE